MVIKIKHLLIFLLFALFINGNSIADNHSVVELDPASSGGAKFVKIPKNAARDFLKEKGLKEGLNKRANGSHLFITIGQGSVTATANSQMIHDARFNAFREAIQNAKSEYVKFLGEKQTSYNMKNWTSVMIFNNAKCKALTPDYINNAPGLDLHQFKWIENIDTEIGEIPLEWNFLADVKSTGQENITKPKLIHYTEGGPFFKATPNCEFDNNWMKVYKRINDFRKH